MGFTIKKSTLTKGFLVFVLLSVAVMVGILVWTTEAETWAQLAQFRWIFVPVLLTLGIVRWMLDGMAFVALSKSDTSPSMRIGRTTVIRLEGSLVAAIVPILVGTFTMHAYLLHKEKMKLSTSMAITVLRAILPVFLFLLNIPILFWMKDDPSSGRFFTQFIKVISLPLVIIIVFFVFTLFYPNQIKKAASGIVRWWGRIKFIRIERILELEERLFHEIDQFSKIFWIYMRKGKRTLLEATGWILAAFMADYFIAFTILWGFHFSPPILWGLAIQFLMRPILYLAPTPGGAGIWEFTYLGFFSLFMSQHLIGVAVFIWRIVLTYIPCIVGVYFLSREFRQDGHLRQIILEKGELPEEDLDHLIMEDKIRQ
jgi:uncharacterized protein (TIRG00374 family)